MTRDRAPGGARALVLLALLLLAGCASGTGGDRADTAAPSSSDTGPTGDDEVRGLGDCALAPAAAAVAPAAATVVVFTRTEGFRHESIEQAGMLLQQAADSAEWTLIRTEEPDELVDALDGADVLVMANTSGDVFEDTHQAAIETWVRAGGGVVAAHSATDTEYDWPFYGEVIGAWSAGHPPGLQEVDLVVAEPDHPSTDHLPERWLRLDEFYDFDRNPRDGGADVLLELDESTATYDPGARPFVMGDDHPVAWTTTIDAGRAFTTNLGHRPETWCDPDFQQHLLGGAAWVTD